MDTNNICEIMQRMTAKCQGGAQKKELEIYSGSVFLGVTWFFLLSPVQYQLYFLPLTETSKPCTDKASIPVPEECSGL